MEAHLPEGMSGKSDIPQLKVTLNRSYQAHRDSKKASITILEGWCRHGAVERQKGRGQLRVCQCVELSRAQKKNDKKKVLLARE